MITIYVPSLYICMCYIGVFICIFFMVNIAVSAKLKNLLNCFIRFPEGVRSVATGPSIAYFAIFCMLTSFLYRLLIVE